MSAHVPLLTRLHWGKQRGRGGHATLAVAVLTALTVVSGVQHAAYAATEGPYGGTPAGRAGHRPGSEL